jgi:hypothetical protein
VVPISESHGDSNQYTPCRGKPDLHRVPDHTSHVVHIVNLSLVHMRTKQTPTPGRSIGDQDSLVRSSPWVTSFFLPHNSLGVGERGFSQVVTQLHQLIGPIYQHVIHTFNACSWGPTHWSLTNTGGGYNLRGADFPHTTL